MISLSSGSEGNLGAASEGTGTPRGQGRNAALALPKDVVMTPAQRYRAMLAAMSDQEREIWRLELRWRKMKPQWHVAAVLVQAMIRQKQAKKRVRQKNNQNAQIKLADQLTNRAANALNKGNFELALSETDEVLRMDPKFAHPHRVRGHTFFRLERFEEAVEEYTLLLQLDKDCEECLMGRAKALCVLERWEPAVDDLETLIELGGEEQLQYFYLRGLVRSKLRQWRGAAEDFSQCLTKGPRTAKAFTQRALAYAGDQNFHNAVQDFSAAIRLNPIPELYCHRGRTHCSMRQWDLAAVDFNQAIRMDPHNADARAGLRTVLMPHDPFPSSKG